MKESEAKNKTCPHLFSAMSVAASIAASNGAPEKAVASLMEKGACHGSGCVMWEPYEYWEDCQGKAWSEDGKYGKRTRVTGGNCGLKSKELDCRGF